MPSAPKTLPRLALPLIVSFTLRFSVQTVDLVYAALLDDPSAVAAIAFWIPFHATYVAIWVGLSAGFTSCLSNAFGHRDESRIKALGGAMLRMMGVLIPLLSGCGVALWFVVPTLGLDPELTRSFQIYGTTMLIGMPLTGFWSVWPDSMVKAHHDTVSTMIAGLVATATNIVLNSVFVFGFGLGLFGIALATVVSRLTALAYAMHRAGRLERARRAEGSFLAGPTRDWPGPVGSILRLSMPAAVTNALTAAEASLVNRLLAGLPNATTALASFGVYHQLLSLALMPTVATAVAVLPYVARNVPEGRHAEVRKDLGRTLLLAVGLGLAFTVPAGVLFPIEIARFFVRGDEAAIGSAATLSALRLLPLAALAATPFLLLRPVFEAMQQPRLGVLVSVARFLLFSFPLVFLGRALAPELGLEPLTGVLAGLITASALASLVTAVKAAACLAPSRG